jgi:hypothetical protein
MSGQESKLDGPDFAQLIVLLGPDERHRVEALRAPRMIELEEKIAASG